MLNALLIPSAVVVKDVHPIAAYPAVLGLMVVIAKRGLTLYIYKKTDDAHLLR